MKISAQVTNSKDRHEVVLRTDTREHSLPIAPRTGGFGSSTNGGELLFLALATCYCNDIYREASKRGIEVRAVEVEVEGDFLGEGQAARSIQYRASVTAKASREEILELMRHTDSVAEIQNTLRQSQDVILSKCDAHPL